MTTIYSVEAQTTNYLSIRGIRSKLGLPDNDFDLFILKELLDNALEFIETNTRKFIESNQNLFTDVIIITDENDKNYSLKFQY